MPELPEVETVLQGIKPYLQGAIIKEVVVRHTQLRWPISPLLREQLLQQSVLNLTRRSKYLLITLKNGTLIVHLGMSGSLRVLPHVHPLKPHDHVDIVLSNEYLLRYNDPRRFGALVWTLDDPLSHPLLKSLGPEPLEASFSADYLYQQTSGRRVAIKSLVMNAHVVVGVGNIYAAEALFLAKIHPAIPAGQLSHDDCLRLVTAIKQVLQQAIYQGGTTVKDFVNSEGKPGYFAQALQVYGQAGKPCKQCHTPLQSLKIGQRSTVFCKLCQLLSIKS